MEKVDAIAKVNSWIEAQNFVTLKGNMSWKRNIASNTKFVQDPTYGNDAIVLQYKKDVILVYYNDNTFMASSLVPTTIYFPSVHKAMLQRLNQFGPRNWRFTVEDKKLHAFQHLDAHHEVYHVDIGGRRLHV